MTPVPKPTNKPDVSSLGAGTWRKGDRIESDEQAEALNWMIEFVEACQEIVARSRRKMEEITDRLGDLR